jgi:hypothetical protein
VFTSSLHKVHTYPISIRAADGEKLFEIAYPRSKTHALLEMVRSGPDMDSQGFNADGGLEIFFLRRLPLRIGERLFGGSEAIFAEFGGLPVLLCNKSLSLSETECPRQQKSRMNLLPERPIRLTSNRRHFLCHWERLLPIGRANGASSRGVVRD